MLWFNQFEVMANEHEQYMYIFVYCNTSANVILKSNGLSKHIRTTCFLCVFCTLMSMNAETIVHTFRKNNATTRQPMCGLVLACSADGAMVPEQNKILCARALHPIHPTIICLHRWNTLRGCVVVEPANNTQTNKQTNNSTKLRLCSNRIVMWFCNGWRDNQI